MKKKINTLNNTLKKCEFDKANLESMFSKRQTQRKQPLHISHTHPAHTHSMLIMLTTNIMLSCMPRCTHVHIVAEKVYAKVYKCTYCDRKGHLVKFHYDRLTNIINHV